jgi:hypothetical protein
MKYILIILLLTGVASAQTTKLDTLHLTFGLINKQDAVEIIKTCQAIFTAASTSETITAKAATGAEQFAQVIAGIIYKRWPDLIPKQQTTK